MSNFFDDIKEATEQGMKETLMNTLETEGFEIECSFCQTPFVAKTIKATCPNCSNTTEINFNL